MSRVGRITTTTTYGLVPIHVPSSIRYLARSMLHEHESMVYVKPQRRDPIPQPVPINKINPNAYHASPNISTSCLRRRCYALPAQHHRIPCKADQHLVALGSRIVSGSLA